MKKILSIFKVIVDFSANIFPFALVFYLVLFLLENLFAGIVSNNFDLNYLLVPVFLFGFLAVFANRDEKEEEEKKNPVKSDFILTIFLTILSFAILYYKTKDQSWEGLAVSLGGAILVGFVSVILIYPEKEESEEVAESNEITESKKIIFNFYLKRIFLSRIRVPVPIVLVILIILTVFNPKNFAIFLQSTALKNKNECAVVPTITPPPFGIPTTEPALVLPAADPLLKILVLNAGAEKGEAKRIGNLFKEAGYKNVEATDSAKNIDNALIEFRDTDSGQADLVEDILRGEYLTVNRAPSATTGAEIKVSLGAQPKPADTGPDYRNENFDFFFR